MKDNGLMRSDWDYAMENYPRGAKVSILVLDNENLFRYGGAIVPTFMWAVEADGRVGDLLWSDFSDPVLNLRSYFDNRCLEQLLLVDRYFDVEWHSLGHDSAFLTNPAGFDKRLVHENIAALYRCLFSRLPEKPETVVLVPETGPMDPDTNAAAYRAVYKEKIDQLRGPGWTPENLRHQGFLPQNYGDAKAGFRGVCYKKRSPATAGFWDKQHFYAWPEIYFRQAVGLTDTLPPETSPVGVKTVYSWFADASRWENAGRKVETIDAFREGDRAWDVTERVYRRWKDRCQGVAYGVYSNDNLNPGWLGFMIRNRYFGFYDTDWITCYPKLAEITRSVGNRHVLGTGDNHNHAVWDYMCMLGLARRKVPCESGSPSVRRGVRLTFAKPPVDKQPWTPSYSDNELFQFKKDAKLGVCLLWGIPELSYNALFPNLVEIHKILRGRCGLGTYVPWIEYYSHWYDKLFTDVYRDHVEPVLFGGATSKLFPIDNVHANFTAADFKTALAFARRQYAEILGEDYVPRGYLASFVEGEVYHTTEITYADTGQTVRLWERAGMPSPEVYEKQIPDNLAAKTKVVKELGFRYYFGSDVLPSSIDGDFTRIATLKRSRPPGDTLNALRRFEQAAGGRPDILAMNFDTGLGFKLMSLLYEQKQRERGDDYSYYGIYSRANLIKYIATGGETGRLVPMRPCELVRYYRMLKDAL